MKLRQLHPEPAELTIEEAAAGADSLRELPEGRPWLALNMVTTLDGRAAIGGRSGPIGGTADRELFLALRPRFDAVMAGARTVTAERYGKTPRAAVIASGRLSVTEDLPLFGVEDQRVLILTASERSLEATAAQVDYVRSPTLAEQMGLLRTEHGIETVLCEGGPTLNSTLLRDGLVDELFVTVAPRIASGEELRMVEGPALPDPLELELTRVLEHESALLLRYLVRVQEHVQ